MLHPGSHREGRGASERPPPALDLKPAKTRKTSTAVRTYHEAVGAGSGSLR